jgi:hypothetical protein
MVASLAAMPVGPKAPILLAIGPYRAGACPRDAAPTEWVISNGVTITRCRHLTARHAERQPLSYLCVLAA